MEKTIFEQLGVTYRQVVNYNLPNLSISRKRNKIYLHMGIATCKTLKAKP